MADRIYFSCWLKGFNERNMLRHFQRMLELFPFSKLAQRGPELRVYAIDHAEPPQFELDFTPGTEPGVMLAPPRDFIHEDCLCEVDAAWDLWQYDRDWRLAPAAVALSCFGPLFDNEIGDHLRIDFGLESRFLPAPGIEGGLRMGESNLKSLVHLVRELERTLDLEKRQLWSESGMSPADAIAQALVN